MTEMHPGAADSSAPFPARVDAAVSFALRTLRRDEFDNVMRLLQPCNNVHCGLDPKQSGTTHRASLQRKLRGRFF
ncbi:hypothetical protein [Fontibacillus sp. BL9]|uniref:hypothetical protein n=1 Tax=Fontibacillus sp. BL9 TaxID=3389971 RepID=UPI00397892DF